MKMRIFRSLGLVVILLVLGLGGTVHAAPWYQPDDVNPGDWYQIAFVTSTGTDARSADLRYYSNFVNSAADNDPDLGLINFRPIISTRASDARDIAFVYGPVYGTRGDRIADGYDDMWDGFLHAPIQYDESTRLGTRLVWTGSAYDGTKDGSNEVGSAFPVIGGSDQTDRNWISADLGPTDRIQSLYAMSDQIQAVPIPPAIWLLGAGLAGLGLIRHRKS